MTEQQDVALELPTTPEPNPHTITLTINVVYDQQVPGVLGAFRLYSNPQLLAATPGVTASITLDGVEVDPS